MTTNEAIDNALTRDIDISREEYAEKCAKADRTTAANGVEGEAPLNEEERERRMRMNYYGSVINIGMAILAALDDVANRIGMLNNNIIALSGGNVADERDDGNAGTGD